MAAGDCRLDHDLDCLHDGQSTYSTNVALQPLRRRDSFAPTVAQGYARVGSDEPHGRQGWRSNFSQRIAGSLNVMSRQLLCWQRLHFDRFTLICYYRELEALYPQAERIWVIQDNWSRQHL